MSTLFKKFFGRGNGQEQEELSRTNPGFEEGERKTPAAGIILLLIMFIAGLFFGWRALDDLARIPSEPQAFSYCSFYFQPGYLTGSLIEPAEPRALYETKSAPYGYEYEDPNYSKGPNYSDCNFNDLEREGGIPALFAKKQDFEKNRSTLEASLNQVNASLSNTRSRENILLQQYNIGLNELQGKINDPLFATPAIRAELQSLSATENQLTVQQTKLQTQISDLGLKIKPINDEIRAAYAPLFEKQNRRLRWYDFQVFLLQIVFVLPFFWFAFREYTKLHAKNSPYTVIATGILAVAAILVLRVILFWFWDLFLAEVLRTLWRWIQQIQILRSIIFYLGMVLSFAVFGGAVYWLQKKIFDPRRVTLRRFRSKQCPYCQTDLGLSEFYCPNCGHQLKEKCANCGESRFIGLPNCPHCGNKKDGV